MEKDSANLYALLAGFTQDGTPLEALIGSKIEWGVTVLTAGAINYYNLIQERLAYYRQNQVHALEKMIDK